MTDEETVAAMRLIWQRLKIIVEPSCATVLAAVIKNKQQFQGQRIGLILTGGNVDLDDLPASVRDKLKFVLVDTVDEVWAAALSDAEPAPDAQEKRRIGDLWAAKSNGQCVFVMPKGASWSDIAVAVAS